ncbi:MAG TPA: PIG-L family deacetylase [Gemmataceae bacterium]|nr:PIG-L family deacetylase [Gemmataceae bacterium]
MKRSRYWLPCVVLLAGAATIGSVIAMRLSATVVASSADDPQGSPAAKSLPPDDGKLRILCFGAHPDDCELQAGGVGAMWAAKGHHVKFVSVTNGDIGHWRDAGGPLARRRLAEVERADKMLGITTEVLDIHDGELMPTLENRRTITRLIREWKADIVMSHRPNDYHPDHRYTGVLVQDTAYMVAVPNFCPDAAPLKKNPLFLFYPDSFQKPNPFQPDIVVSIDSVIEKKLDALGVMESQFYEGGALGSADLLSTDPARQQERKKQVRAGHASRNEGLADRFRSKLIDWYGKETADKVKYAEAFEICEYGRKPAKQELAELFPFFGGK